jgi:transcriptional regulator with XRE-family HTH domain
MQISHRRAGRMTPGEDFRERVTRMRERAGWSQSELARRVSEQLTRPLSQSALSRIETGDRAVTIDEAYALAFAFNVEPAELIAPKLSEADLRKLVKRGALSKQRTLGRRD